jgi:hypothetical protein
MSEPLKLYCPTCDLIESEPFDIGDSCPCCGSEALVELDSFIRGAETALWRYAHWRDGVQYVGNCGRTYDEALAEFTKLRDRARREER